MLAIYLSTEPRRFGRDPDTIFQIVVVAMLANYQKPSCFITFFYPKTKQEK